MSIINRESGTWKRRFLLLQRSRGCLCRVCGSHSEVERCEGSGPEAEEAFPRRGKKEAEGRMETKGSRNRNRRGGNG